jgi:hypothetical protein
MNRRRLDWEATLDALLAAAGDLDRTVGGPAMEITSLPFPRRRTIYARIERQNLPGLFRAFDFATPDAHAPQRFTTTVPQQALYLLNGGFVMERAEALSRRHDIEAAADPAQRIVRLYQAALGRSPTADELALGLEFVAKQSAAPPLPSPEEILAESWQYGYGSYDEATKRISSFTPLAHFTGAAWQASSTMPDPQTGWAMISAEGGHAGNDLAHAVIRRWTAPRDGLVRIEGNIKLTEPDGDGVRARVVASGSGPAGEWIAEPKKKPEKTNVERVPVKAGETIDFVVDLRNTIEHDSFSWIVVVHFQSVGDVGAAGDPIVWDSAATFRRPRPNPTDVWARYAQVLLVSNEFVFVD